MGPSGVTKALRKGSSCSQRSQSVRCQGWASGGGCRILAALWCAVQRENAIHRPQQVKISPGMACLRGAAQSSGRSPLQQSPWRECTCQRQNERCCLDSRQAKLSAIQHGNSPYKRPAAGVGRIIREFHSPAISCPRGVQYGDPRVGLHVLHPTARLLGICASVSLHA